METIADILRRCNDRELMEVLPYIKNGKGERMTLAELKEYLKEEKKRNER